MHLASVTMPHPLREDSDGVFRVGDTRVTLRTVITAWDQRSSAEEITLRYPVLGLEQVYSTIGFFLANEAELRGYLAEEAAASAEARRESEQRPTVARLRERLRMRRTAAMASRLLADENFDVNIVRGLVCRVPGVDIVRIEDSG